LLFLKNKKNKKNNKQKTKTKKKKKKKKKMAVQSKEKLTDRRKTAYSPSGGQRERRRQRT